MYLVNYLEVDYTLPFKVHNVVLSRNIESSHNYLSLLLFIMLSKYGENVLIDLIHFLKNWMSIIIS